MPQERRRDRRTDPREQEHRSRRADARDPERARRPASRESEHPRRRRRRSAGLSMLFALLYVVGVIGVSVILACVGWAAANDVLALNKPEKEIIFQVSDGESFEEVTDRLAEEGMIEYKLLFKLFASFTHGKEKVAPGSYTLSTNMDYRALLSGMSANSASKVELTVTIPEGYTTAQIFQLLENMDVATVEDLNQMASTHDYAFDFLEDIPLGSPNRLEGYLFPSTYNFYTYHDPKYAINKLLVAFDERMDEELRQEIADSGRSMHEILTVASLIERETDGTDRATIASVIYNRLDNPSASTAGYLQIDATLGYINGGKVPTEADKSIDSPYNTYLYQGLPPGPISNPGLDSIRAAIHPESTKYYYYALGDDNVHHFFRSYEDHKSFLASQERYKAS